MPRDRFVPVAAGCCTFLAHLESVLKTCNLGFILHSGNTWQGCYTPANMAHRGPAGIEEIVAIERIIIVGGGTAGWMADSCIKWLTDITVQQDEAQRDLCSAPDISASSMGG